MDHLITGLDKISSQLTTAVVMESTSKFMRGMSQQARRPEPSPTPSHKKSDQQIFSHINRKKMNESIADRREASIAKDKSSAKQKAFSSNKKQKMRSSPSDRQGSSKQKRFKRQRSNHSLLSHENKFNSKPEEKKTSAQKNSSRRQNRKSIGPNLNINKRAPSEEENKIPRSSLTQAKSAGLISPRPQSQQSSEAKMRFVRQKKQANEREKFSDFQNGKFEASSKRSHAQLSSPRTKGDDLIEEIMHTKKRRAEAQKQAFESQYQNTDKMSAPKKSLKKLTQYDSNPNLPTHEDVQHFKKSSPQIKSPNGKPLSEGLYNPYSSTRGPKQNNNKNFEQMKKQKETLTNYGARKQSFGVPEKTRKEINGKSQKTVQLQKHENVGKQNRPKVNKASEFQNQTKNNPTKRYGKEANGQNSAQFDKKPIQRQKQIPSRIQTKNNERHGENLQKSSANRQNQKGKRPEERAPQFDQTNPRQSQIKDTKPEISTRKQKMPEKKPHPAESVFPKKQFQSQKTDQASFRSFDKKREQKVVDSQKPKNSKPENNRKAYPPKQQLSTEDKGKSIGSPQLPQKPKKATDLMNRPTVQEQKQREEKGFEFNALLKTDKAVKLNGGKGEKKLSLIAINRIINSNISSSLLEGFQKMKKKETLVCSENFDKNQVAVYASLFGSLCKSIENRKIRQAFSALSLPKFYIQSFKSIKSIPQRKMKDSFEKITNYNLNLRQKAVSLLSVTHCIVARKKRLFLEESFMRLGTFIGMTQENKNISGNEIVEETRTPQRKDLKGERKKGNVEELETENKKMNRQRERVQKMFEDEIGELKFRREELKQLNNEQNYQVEFQKRRKSQLMQALENAEDYEKPSQQGQYVSKENTKLPKLAQIYLTVFKNKNTSIEIASLTQAASPDESSLEHQWIVAIENAKLKNYIDFYENGQCVSRKGKQDLEREEKIARNYVRSYIKEQYLWQWVRKCASV